MIVLGQDEIVCDFVASGFPHIDSFPSHCIGIGVDRGGYLEGGVVIELKTDFDAYVTVYAPIGKIWSRKIVEQVFGFIFKGLGVVRITAEAAKGNKRSRRLIAGLGFRQEGCKRKGYDGKQDKIIYGMTKEECRWIKVK